MPALGWLTRSRSLTLRFSLWAGAALIASATASAYVGARQEQRALLDEVGRHAGQLAELLAADSAQALFTFSVGDLENTVGAFARDPTVRIIEIRDRSGNMLKAHGGASGRYGLVIATRDVRAGGQVIGSVVLGLSADAAKSAVTAAWRLLVVREVAALVLLFGVLAFLVRRVVSRPLGRIAEIMRDVAEGRGELTRRAEITSRDEVGELARQFNQMADQLHASHEELARRVADTTAKNAELDAFVHSVSHDLKTPLVTIQGFCGLLREHCGPGFDAEGQRYLDRLETNVQRMAGLIADLLAFARIGREAQSPEAVDLSAMVDDLQVEMRGLIEARGVKIIVRDVGTLWAIRSQIEQVFRNLLSNAVKYAGDTASPTVEIGMRSQGEMWECYVRDDGIGIDPAYHEQIFEIFQRLKDVEVEGSGVGLAIVKKVVDNAGGRVWVESSREEGATFRFTWPKRPG